MTSSQEVEIQFEEINLKKVIRQKKVDIIIIVVGLFFGVIFLVNLILKVFDKSDITWGVIILLFSFTVLSGLIAYVNLKRQILIPTSNSGLLDIFDGRPTKEATDNFIHYLTLRSNIYLKHKYGSIDRDLPIEPQLTNLMWLKEREILNETEFEELKNKLLGRNDKTNPIGFR